MPLFSATALAVLFLVCTIETLRATIIFTETFDYPAGDLEGNGPPSDAPVGQGGWTDFMGSVQVTSGALSYPGSPSVGNTATLFGLDATLGDYTFAASPQGGGPSGGVVWISFLMNVAGGGSSPGGYAAVNLQPTDGSSPGINIGVLDDENVYGIDNNSDGSIERASTTEPVNGTVVLLVVKLDFNAGMEYIFVDPSLDIEPPNDVADANQAMTSAFQASGFNQVTLEAGDTGASFNVGALTIGTTFADIQPTPPFFTGEVALANGVYYLLFPNGNYFGYYSFLSDPDYIYHFDLGYEYVFDAADSNSGVYFYDFASGHFFYTSPVFSFPYLYDFSLNSVLYYYPDPNNAGRYNTNGIRYFYVFSTGQIISM